MFGNQCKEKNSVPYIQRGPVGIKNAIHAHQCTVFSYCLLCFFLRYDYINITINLEALLLPTRKARVPSSS